MKEYMESELSGIFPVKLATKIIVRGSPGTQFMHMRVNSPKTSVLCDINSEETFYYSLIWKELFENLGIA